MHYVVRLRPIKRANDGGLMVGPFKTAEEAEKWCEGLDLTPEETTYATEDEAWKGIATWAKRYELQGYYKNRTIRAYPLLCDH